MTPLVGGSTGSLLDDHDAVLFDLDGVLYIGPDVVSGAAVVVAAVRARGVAIAYVTNNASRTPQTVAAHLSDLGIPASPDEVATSAQAVATLVAAAHPADSPVLVVGGDGLRVALADRGLRPVDRADEGPVAVVQGFGPEVGWRQLAEGTYAVRAGVPWYASNLDATVPTPGGIAPGNGALVDVIAATTGQRPAVAGKPEPPLHEEAVSRAGAQQPLVVGDRLDTDIEGANRVGAASLLVLTGIATPLELVNAPVGLRPTYVSEDLATGLLAAHPPVTTGGDGERSCGGWTATFDGPRVTLRGTGERVDALRALCVAVWADEGQASGRAAEGVAVEGAAVEGAAEALALAGW